MLINARSRRELALELNRQLRLRRRFERRMRAAILRETRRVGRAVVTAIENANREMVAVEAAMSDHNLSLERIYRAHIEAIARTFGASALSAIKGSGIKIEVKQADDAFEIELNNYLRTVAGERIVNVSETTKRRIRKALADLAVDETPSVATIRKEITRITGGSIGRIRAAVIARTEMHAASVAAQDFAVIATNIPFTRRWVAALDGRTRGNPGDKTSHQLTDGQRVATGAPFAVVRLDGGQPDHMKRPGDPKGPADQVINCRCVVVYEEPDNAGPELVE